MVFRDVVTGCVEDLCGNHLGARLEFRILFVIKLDDVGVALAVFELKTGSNSLCLGFCYNSPCEVRVATLIRPAYEIVNRHPVKMMTVRVPARIGHLVHRVDVCSRLRMSHRGAKITWKIQILFCLFNDLVFEEVIVDARRTFLRFWYIFHVEVEPEKLRSRPDLRVGNEGSQCGCNEK